MRILMVAAENGALPGGKVGGMGDVIRDIPKALARLGHDVSVIMPGYQRFSQSPDARLAGNVDLLFAGQKYTVNLFRLQQAGIETWVLEHPEFAPCGSGKIYCDDLPGRPFATDATKFALFSAAVIAVLRVDLIDMPDVIHLHDWHTALVAVLARYQNIPALAETRLVFTIHNLALQGIRPLKGDPSALESWFPDLEYDTSVVNDPRYPHCFNPLRAAINLCDRVHAVSPNYVREIQLPSAPEKGFVGGEGLERDLQVAAGENRLKGVLNGCEYPAEEADSPSLTLFLADARRQVLSWVGQEAAVASSHFIAASRIDEWLQVTEVDFVVTSVGRLTQQKAQLLVYRLEDGRTCLEHLLDLLPPKAAMVMLGSGDPDIEGAITAVAGIHSNLLFLRGFAETLSDDIYRLGDLFLMPSSFEPCGISQMFAMREGQPCLVHGVGGLADTVSDNRTGFVFSGTSVPDQVRSLIRRFAEVLALWRDDPARWQEMCTAASAERFDWNQSAELYVQELYRGD